MKRWKTTAVLLTMAMGFFQPSVNVRAASSVYIASKQEQKTEGNLSYSLCYPQVSGIDDLDGQRLINVLIRERAITSALRAAALAKSMENRSAAVEGTLVYRVSRNSAGMASIVMDDQLYASQQRTAERFSYTFSLKTARVYTLGDLFRPKADYIDLLSPAVNAMIAERGMSDKMVKPFTRISPSQKYYLTDNSLVLYFQPGEYFYADQGVVEFEIKAQDIAEYVNSEIFG